MTSPAPDHGPGVTVAGHDGRNPLHEVGGPATAWTTVNTRENFPGVATPLGWTFWRDPLERGLKGAFCDLGVLPRAAVTVPASVDDRFSAAVFGRFAANVDCLRRAADLMPGTSGEALEEQLLGSVRPGVESHPSKRRYPVIALKIGPDRPAGPGPHPPAADRNRPVVAGGHYPRRHR